MKKEPFEIYFFSVPTSEDLAYYWSKAREAGISRDKFETLWFAAYNDFISRVATRHFQVEMLKRAENLIKDGPTPRVRNLGRQILNEEIVVSNKKYGTGISKLELEAE